MKYFYITSALIAFIGLVVFFRNINNFGDFSIDYDNEVSRYITLDKANTNCVNPLGYTHPGSVVNYINSNGKTEKDCVAIGSIVIDSYIEKTVFDNYFMLVDQKPTDVICECNGVCSNVSNDTPGKCKEALKKSDLDRYWIISKWTNNVFGPFTLNEFENKRIELNVPTNLEFNNWQL